MWTPTDLMDVVPVPLIGRLVRLEPLMWDHLDGLEQVMLDPELWRWTVARVRNREDLRQYIERALADQTAGNSVAFATIAEATGQTIGSTRFHNIDRGNKRLEIGSTTIARPWQGSGANTEAKLLMLEHAFERLGCHRVEFKTDSLNERSRAALSKIGAAEEGIFRNHMVTESGRLRHSAWFSIIAEEWPTVKRRLASMLPKRLEA